MKTLEETIIAIIIKDLRLKNREITLDTKLEDLEADSLDRAEIIFSLEDEFKITVEMPAKGTFVTVQSVVDWIRPQIPVVDTK